MSEFVYDKLVKDVINAGLCAHCGTCVGLSKGKLYFESSAYGPLPSCKSKPLDLDHVILDACPAYKLNHPALQKYVFNRLPDNWLIGHVKKCGVGYSGDEYIRRIGSSGGVITQVLIHLIETKTVEGVITLKLGNSKPYQAEPVIATTKEEIIECAQSIYAPIPVNTILDKSQFFKGSLAYVGLPEQVASIRKLQQSKHPSVSNIKYILGPYVGITMYQDAIASYLRSNGYKGLEDIEELKYRDGEWPGYLRITTKDDKTLKAEKFYYNYLLPFFITRSTLHSIDFSNEYTDISVGDAWNPVYENIGKGFAVVIARTEKGISLLEELAEERKLIFEPKTVNEVMNMHGHMFDFKKRGSFIRMQFRKFFGKRVPEYGLKPLNLKPGRYLVEFFISGIFLICRTRIAKKIIEWIPISILGKFFNFTRKKWKSLSKPTKRKGLADQQYETLFD
jgi:coenzyme F420 hydrogenase subunit beta